MLCISLLALTESSSTSSAAPSPSLIQRAMQPLQGGGPQTVMAPTSVDVAFSPAGGATDLVVKTIASAKQTIRVAAYSFTSRPIARALVDARRAGVDVEVIVDHDQIDKDNHSAIPFLADANEHNAENVIVLWGAPQLAAAYTKDWKNLWDQAETYQKR